GTFQHTIDPKGRLSIPSRYRQELAERRVEGLVLTVADRYVVAFPQDEWTRFTEKLSEQPQFDPDAREFVRAIVGNAKECAIDRAGRTLVPPDLRDAAGLQKQVIIVGALRSFELWSPDRHAEYRQRAQSNFSVVARRASEFGM